MASYHLSLPLRHLHPHYHLLFFHLLTTTLIVTSPTVTLSLTCTSPSLPSNKLYQNCDDLPTLDSYLHWTYSAPNATLSLAFLAPFPSHAAAGGWVAWAFNPISTGMKGSQSFTAFTDPATGSATVKTYNISSYTSVVEAAELSVRVYEKSAEFTGGMMAIYATLAVPASAAVSGKLNYIWQVGGSVTDGRPDPHEIKPVNLNSVGSLDLAGGGRGGSSSLMSFGGGGVWGAFAKIRSKDMHGILNAVSWGILFPVGAIIARYLRTFPAADPAWFYLHASCQVSAYAIGIAGWSTGLKLGSESKGIVFNSHRSIGTALFCLATVQISALLVRPKKDHKFRFYWNIYHYSLGYTVIILGAVNIFKGLSILNPVKTWRSGYIYILSALGGISLLLEAVTWVVVLRRKSSTKLGGHSHS